MCCVCGCGGGLPLGEGPRTEARGPFEPARYMRGARARLDAWWAVLRLPAACTCRGRGNACPALGPRAIGTKRQMQELHGRLEDARGELGLTRSRVLCIERELDVTKRCCCLQGSCEEDLRAQKPRKERAGARRRVLKGPGDPLGRAQRWHIKP